MDNTKFKMPGADSSSQWCHRLSELLSPEPSSLALVGLLLWPAPPNQSFPEPPGSCVSPKGAPGLLICLVTPCSFMETRLKLHRGTDGLLRVRTDVDAPTQVCTPAAPRALSYACHTGQESRDPLCNRKDCKALQVP